MFDSSIVHDTSIVIASAAIFGAIFYFLRQPVILGYIIGGILIGPLGFDFLTNPGFIHTISSLGIILLLYLIGIELDFEKMKDIGLRAFLIGIFQILITGAITYFLAQILNFDSWSSFYIALGVSFSSTVVVIKLLLEKDHLYSLYGRVCIGILLIQDIAAIIALLFLTSLSEGDQTFDFVNLLFWFNRGILLCLGAFLLSKYVLSKLFQKLSDSNEIIMIIGICWCFALAMLFEMAGFSREIGAFIAGLALSSLQHSVRVAAKAKVLRDFFITMFFVALGASLTIPEDFTVILIPLIVFSLIVLILKPLIISFVMGLYGFSKKTSFFASTSLSQISEFSLILAALGLELRHIDQSTVSIITMLMIVTLILSTYIMHFNTDLYSKMKNIWKIFELRGKFPEILHGENFYKDHIVLVGCDSLGQILLEEISKFDKPIVVIDENPGIVSYISHHGISCVFGDIEDEEVLDHVNVKEAELIISTIPYQASNIHLLKYLKSHQSKAITFVVAHNTERAKELRNAGADFILLAKFVLGNYLREILDQIYNLKDRRSSRGYHIFVRDKEDFRVMFTEKVIKENLEKIKEIREKVG